MKKSILAIALCTFTTGVILTSCSTSAERVEKAEKNVIDANKDLEKANAEYLVDIENYKMVISEKIAANQKRVDAFNERISKEKKEARADYKKKIAELEQKNSDMKKKLDDYKAEGKEKWEAFKTEFSRDMDELGNALKNVK